MYEYKAQYFTGSKNKIMDTDKYGEGKINDKDFDGR